MINRIQSVSSNNNYKQNFGAKTIWIGEEKTVEAAKALWTKFLATPTHFNEHLAVALADSPDTIKAEPLVDRDNIFTRAIRFTQESNPSNSVTIGPINNLLASFVHEATYKLVLFAKKLSSLPKPDVETVLLEQFSVKA